MSVVSGSSSSNRNTDINHNGLTGGGGGESTGGENGRGSGRFYQRLIEQEREIKQLKEQYAQLMAHCSRLEVWKKGVEKWIREEFGTFGVSHGLQEGDREGDQEEQEHNGEGIGAGNFDVDVGDDFEVEDKILVQEGQEEDDDMQTPSIVNVSGAVPMPVSQASTIRVAGEDDLVSDTIGNGTTTFHMPRGPGQSPVVATATHRPDGSVVIQDGTRKIIVKGGSGLSDQQIQNILTLDLKEPGRLTLPGEQTHIQQRNVAKPAQHLAEGYRHLHQTTIQSSPLIPVATSTPIRKTNNDDGAKSPRAGGSSKVNEHNAEGRTAEQDKHNRSPRATNRTPDNFSIDNNAEEQNQAKRRSSPRATNRSNKEDDAETSPPNKKLKQDSDFVIASPSKSKEQGHSGRPPKVVLVVEDKKTWKIKKDQNKPSSSTSTAVIDDNDDDDEVQIVSESNNNRNTFGKHLKTTPVKLHNNTTSSQNSQESKMAIDDDAPCQVCGDPETEENNTIIACDNKGCNLTVHQACYGVAIVPKGEWLCNPCQVGKDPSNITCRFCPKKGGALKPVISPGKNSWAHVWCTWWIPEVKMGSRKTQEPVIGVNTISKARTKLKCKICKIPGGICIQCQKGRCTVAYHATCAQEADLKMDRIDLGRDEQGNDKGLQLLSYCKKCGGKGR